MTNPKFKVSLAKAQHFADGAGIVFTLVVAVWPAGNEDNEENNTATIAALCSSVFGLLGVGCKVMSKGGVKMKKAGGALVMSSQLVGDLVTAYREDHSMERTGATLVVSGATMGASSGAAAAATYLCGLAGATTGTAAGSMCLACAPIAASVFAGYFVGKYANKWATDWWKSKEAEQRIQEFFKNNNLPATATNKDVNKWFREQQKTRHPDKMVGNHDDAASLNALRDKLNEDFEFLQKGHIQVIPLDGTYHDSSNCPSHFNRKIFTNLLFLGDYVHDCGFLLFWNHGKILHLVAF